MIDTQFSVSDGVVTFTITDRKGQIFTCLVDEADWEKVKSLNWHISKHKAKGRTLFYVSHSYKLSGKNKSLKLHRFLLNPERFKLVDHKNGNGLDNRRENLRESSKAQNAFNQIKISGTSSSFKGVFWRKDLKKFEAYIKTSQTGKPVRKYLGLFVNEVDAARAYNEAALTYFGEFARLNEIPRENSDGK